MQNLTQEQVYDWLAEISDPEIPVLSILDLGIVRAVYILEDKIQIIITPTYSGCPAMDIISMQIRMALIGRGFNHIDIKMQLSPAWTTDWISESGKEKMKAYGVAPPTRKSNEGLGLFEEDVVPCPRCDANETELISQFGSTSCKSMYRCLSCKEPFEHFKCH